MKNYFLTVTFCIIWISSYGQSTVAQTPSKITFKCVEGGIITLKVTDLDKSQKYYSDIIGLTLLPIPERFKPVCRWFKIADGCELHLFAGRTTFVNSDYTQIQHLLLKTNKGDNLKYKNNALISKDIVSKGVPGGLSTIYILDPDGYVVQIAESN